jgi:hypothetical protein
LSKYDHRALHRLGFFDRDRDLLERLIATLSRTTAAGEELRPLAQSVLAQIEALVPEFAAHAHSALEMARLFEDLERKQWWAPHDIAGPPSTEPVAPPADFRREDVARVLRDL